MRLERYLEERKAAADAVLERELPPVEGPAGTVIAAMRYAVGAGGKRLRPILAWAAYEALGGAPAEIELPAVALELIHTYSLIHDDLPAMDDDDLRRGKPTVHRAFGEAEAILAGDALHTLAFEWLANFPRGDDRAVRRSEAVAIVARQAGTAGMVGGQIADLEAERTAPEAAMVLWIHQHKTAALLAASTELGAVHAGADATQRAALSEFGIQVGLAFQIADDLLDCTADAATLGKTPGKDARAGKATAPALFGFDRSREMAEECVELALQRLREADLLTDTLAALARFSISRKL